MRHRQKLLVGLGVCALWLLFCARTEAQQHPNYRVLKYPTAATASKYYVTIMGEVGRPGVYEFDRPEISLPELIESAGGLREETTSRNIKSFRNGRPGPQTFYTQDSQFVVMQGDILAAGRRADYGADRSGRQNGSVQSMPVEPSQVVVQGIADRPVLLELPQNMASIPGLFALLHQDRNPARRIAVYPPNSAPFSYTAQNTQPVPLESGTIVMFDPQTVMRDGIPPLPPVANARRAESQQEQTSQFTPPTGPKVLITPASQTSSLEMPTSHPESVGVANRGEQHHHASHFDSESNATSPKFHHTSRSEMVRPSEVTDVAVASTVSGPMLGSEPAASELKFPGSAEVESPRLSRVEEPSILDEETAADKEAIANDPILKSESIAESLTLTRKKESDSGSRRASEFPIWLVMAITGIGVFCIAGLVILLRDMQQFKKIVIETRNSQSILDQLVRGELPLHEETVEPAHTQHFTGRPGLSARRYRSDEAHQSTEEERWVPQPHVSFETQPATSADRSERSYRVDSEDERLPPRREGRPAAGGRTPAPTVSSSTILDRILSSVNGDRNARRS